MTMTDDEREVLTGAAETLQAIGVALGAALAVVNEEVPNFRERTLARLANASMALKTPLAVGGDQKVLAMAAQFVGALDEIIPRA